MFFVCFRFRSLVYCCFCFLLYNDRKTRNSRDISRMKNEEELSYIYTSLSCSSVHWVTASTAADSVTSQTSYYMRPASKAGRGVSPRPRQELVCVQGSPSPIIDILVTSSTSLRHIFKSPHLLLPTFNSNSLTDCVLIFRYHIVRVYRRRDRRMYVLGA